VLSGTEVISKFPQVHNFLSGRLLFAFRYVLPLMNSDRSDFGPKASTSLTLRFQWVWFSGSLITSLRGPSFHFSLHPSHVLLHSLLNLWILVKHIPQEGFLEIFVLNSSFEEHLVMHLALFEHHFEELLFFAHFVEGCLLFSGSSGDGFHVIQTLLLLLDEDFDDLISRECWLLSLFFRLSQLTLLGSHHILSCWWILC